MSEYLDDAQIQFTIATKVSDSVCFDSVRRISPFLAHMMLQKYVEFLNNADFGKYERQAMLVQFMETQHDLKVVQEVFSSLNKSALKDDYAAIILEHSYKQSDAIIQDIVKSTGNAGLLDSSYSNMLAPIQNKAASLSTNTSNPNVKVIKISGNVDNVLEAMSTIFEQLSNKEEDDGGTEQNS